MSSPVADAAPGFATSWRPCSLGYTSPQWFSGPSTIFSQETLPQNLRKEPYDSTKNMFTPEFLALLNKNIEVPIAEPKQSTNRNETNPYAGETIGSVLNLLAEQHVKPKVNAASQHLQLPPSNSFEPNQFLGGQLGSKSELPNHPRNVTEMELAHAAQLERMKMLLGIHQFSFPNSPPELKNEEGVGQHSNVITQGMDPLRKFTLQPTQAVCMPPSLNAPVTFNLQPFIPLGPMSLPETPGSNYLKREFTPKMTVKRIKKHKKKTIVPVFITRVTPSAVQNTAKAMTSEAPKTSVPVLYPRPTSSRASEKPKKMTLEAPSEKKLSVQSLTMFNSKNGCLMFSLAGRPSSLNLASNTITE